MVFVLNLIFAILAFLVIRYLAADLGTSRQMAVVLAVLGAILVYLLDLGARV